MIFYQIQPEFKKVDINIADIKEFGVFNKWSYRKDNTFKKFIKCGYVVTDKKIEVSHKEIIQLKKILKEKNIVFHVKRKTPIFATKQTVHGLEQRKSINWDYTIKE